MAKVNNPRFPHKCRVYRIVNETSWDDGKEETLYNGECMRYSASSLRTFYSNDVIRGEYALDIPVLVRGVGAGCFVDVTDYIGEKKGIMICDAQPSEMGTTLFFDIPKN